MSSHQQLAVNDAQKLIKSQRAEIAAQVDHVVNTKGSLPEEFLKKAADLFGRYTPPEGNEEAYKELNKIYRGILAQRPYDRAELPIFGDEFLYAILGDQQCKASNLQFELREIVKLCGRSVPKFLERS